MKVLVLTVSDRASRGQYEDLSGPAIEKVLRERIADVSISRKIVPDEHPAIRGAFDEAAGFDAIITTGGTGLSPRDVTPEATTAYCDRLVPGIAETLRAESYRLTPHAMLSRGVAGVKDNALIINLPGSVKAAEFCAGLLAPVLVHAVKMIRGEGH